MSERELFIAALQKEPEDRPALLDQACADDPDLRRRVEILLKAHEMAGGLLDLPAHTAATDVMNAATAAPADARPDHTTANGLVGDGAPRPITEGPGTRVGPYKLLQAIGEGGMGTVCMAEQEHPVRRRVALKIIKPGMDSAQVIARFEAERQALALMDHPNIARVLDAGTTDSGRPYFVMELVNGIPITQYCDENRLNPRERLELFIPVCQAVQHAHQKGIIHRDIKPSNVLVTLYDGRPVPKVIDFGIAKATAQRLTEKTMFTQFGSIIGTLEYMSPEQAEMSALGVDTRSDIYSLGALLYELLTGTTPLERSQVREAAYVELLRRIKEDEPPRPSTRLSESRDRLPSISAQRRTDPARLAKAVRGDLDWIVMKSLEKDRAHRYESASGFARDVQRYLDGDAVEACPPSAIYRLRKFARKHRAGLAIASAFAAMLLLGVVVSTWQAIRATAAERRALSEADRAAAAEAQARHQAEHARSSAAEAQAVWAFFRDQILTAARPEGQEGGLGKDVTIRQAIDAAEPRIAGAFPGQPNVEAAIRNVLGLNYYYLGEPTFAIRQLERALELSKAGLGPDHPETLTTRNNLGMAHLEAGHLDRALALFESQLAAQTARLGPDHPETLTTQNNLAVAYVSAGRLDRAIPLLERTLAARAARLGPDHAETLTTQNNLAAVYTTAGRPDRAIPLLERTLASRTAQQGPEHPNTLTAQHNLAKAYIVAGQRDRAIPLLERTLAIKVKVLGPDHPDTLSTQYNLAVDYHEAGQTDRAIALLQSTAAAYVAKRGADHPDTLTCQAYLAYAYEKRGDLVRSEAIFRDVVARSRTHLGGDHPDLAAALSQLGSCLLEQRRWNDAQVPLEESLRIRVAKLPDDWRRFHSASLLGGGLLGQGKYAAAEPLIVSGYEGMKAREARVRAGLRPLVKEAAGRVVELYEAWGKPGQAVAWREKLGLPKADAKSKR